MKIDAIQMEQVLLNILRNGIEALQADGVEEKRITIHAFEDGKHGVRIDIRDTGPGMDAETLRQVFKSFFTTKGDKGMGMGLSISRSIVESHGGRIWAESTPGQGTCFSIALPLESELGQTDQDQ
jgi:signal transduction histidine kinase